MGWPVCTRRVGKWLGVGASIAIVAAFGLSELWYVDCYSSDRFLFHLTHGAAGIAWRHNGWNGSRTGAVSPHRWLAARHSGGIPTPIWRISTTNGPAWNSVIVPLWMAFVAVAGPTAILWRWDRRRTPDGHCRCCGYDLTVNVSGRCSECGLRVQIQSR